MLVSRLAQEIFLPEPSIPAGGSNEPTIQWKPASLPWEQTCRGLKLTAHLQLLLILSMNRVILPSLFHPPGLRRDKFTHAKY